MVWGPCGNGLDCRDPWPAPPPSLARAYTHTHRYLVPQSLLFSYSAQYNGVYVGLLFRLITQTRWESGQGSLVKYLLRKITLGRGLIISICLVWLFGKAMWLCRPYWASFFKCGIQYKAWKMDEILCVCVLREYRQFDLVFPKTHLCIINIFLHFGDDIQYLFYRPFYIPVLETFVKWFSTRGWSH